MSKSPAKEHIAVIDIGSNAVRLVIFDAADRAPVRIHNERNICSLGSDLGLTGRLNPEGVEKAMDSLGRFSGLISAMGIKTIHAVATAALRDAEDGAEFAKRVKKEFGLSIRVIDGDEEARLAGIGVMMNGLGTGGIIGDYGGGSLELIVIESGKIQHKHSLPIGSHRLQALKTREARIKAIDTALDGVSFLKKHTGRDFYALGGAWRAMAKAHMTVTDHPLRVIDHYAIGGKAAQEYADVLSRQSLGTLEKTSGFSKKRVQDIGVAALALERVFARLKPSRLVFSGTGLREGLVFDSLPPKVQREDALIASARKMVVYDGRDPELSSYTKLMQWMLPLFPGAPAPFLRLLEAACLVSDISWAEHEDYQAGPAFDRLLVAPLYGADHPARAFLALSTYVRYAGKPPKGAASVDQVALVTGLALRLAYALTGGVLDLLKYSQLKVTPKYLTLTLQGKGAALKGSFVQDALDLLANALGREGKID